MNGWGNDNLGQLSHGSETSGKTRMTEIDFEPMTAVAPLNCYAL